MFTQWLFIEHPWNASPCVRFRGTTGNTTGQASAPVELTWVCLCAGQGLGQAVCKSGEQTQSAQKKESHEDSDTGCRDLE